MRLRAAARTAALVLVAACGSGPGSVGGTPDSTRGASPLAVPVVRALPAGTVLRLLPSRVVVEGDAPVDTGFVDALLREALRLSTRFDIAADSEDGPTGHALAPRLDARAGQLAVALHEEGTSARPLVAVAFDPARPTAAVDAAAVAIRVGLGETVAAMPPPIADLYSASVECVRLTERALGLESQGTTLDDIVERARAADPGCALTWNALASWHLAAGRPADAARTAQTALTSLSRRMSPTTAHRLARVLLLARARAAGPAGARGFDAQLLELGQAFVDDRPHDPHGRYTRALASNFLGDFAAARTDLEVLLPRWPKVPWVAYHLTFACLGVGAGAAALDAIEHAARRLPFGTVFMPRALALHAAGELDELAELLAQARARELDATPFGHEVLRMQAALAILRGDREAAITALFEDFEWLRQRPSLLDERAQDVAEAGEVLVRLDAGDPLAARIAALRAVPTLGPTLGLALAYVEGLAATRYGDDAIAALALGTLERAQSDAWAARLRAARARRTGDVAAEARELATALRLHDAPLCRAAFARALTALGRREEADALLAETRADLLRIDLRLPLDHPLLSPGRALAFLATEPR